VNGGGGGGSCSPRVQNTEKGNFRSRFLSNASFERNVKASLSLSAFISKLFYFCFSFILLRIFFLPIFRYGSLLFGNFLVNGTRNVCREKQFMFILCMLTIHEVKLHP
jgi:hypothetical protein